MRTILTNIHAALILAAAYISFRWYTLCGKPEVAASVWEDGVETILEITGQ